MASEHETWSFLDLIDLWYRSIRCYPRVDIILSDSCCHALQSRKSIASAESVLMATVDLDEQDRRVMSSSEASSSSEGCSIDEVNPMADTAACE